MKLRKVVEQLGAVIDLTESEYQYAKKLLEIVGNDEEPLGTFHRVCVNGEWFNAGGIVLPSGNYEFKGAVAQRTSGNIIHGLFFGFPKCCIKYFITVKSIDRDDGLAMKGTGYIRCPACAKLPIEEVIAGINARRVEIATFPESNVAQNVMHRWYFAATHDFTDIVEYCNRE